MDLTRSIQQKQTIISNMNKENKNLISTINEQNSKIQQLQRQIITLTNSTNADQRGIMRRDRWTRKLLNQKCRI